MKLNVLRPREASAVRLDDLLAHQRAEVGLQLGAVAPAGQQQRRLVAERLADDGRGLDDRELGGVKSIEAGGEHRVDRGAAWAERTFPARGGARRSACGRAPRQTADSPRRSRPPDRERSVATPASPTSCSTSARQSASLSGSTSIRRTSGRPWAKFGLTSKSSARVTAMIRTGDGADRHRQVLDELEKRGLGPLDVLEDNHERALAPDRLQQLAHRPEDVLRVGGGIHHPERARDALGHDGPVVVRRQQAGDPRQDLVASCRRPRSRPAPRRSLAAARRSGPARMRGSGRSQPWLRRPGIGRSRSSAGTCRLRQVRRRSRARRFPR